MALSVADHSHSDDAWRWVKILPADARLVFSRFTQLGLLRLLTNSAVMGSRPLTLRQAWKIYDRWLEDPRIEFYPEPRNLDAGFRQATEPFAAKATSKRVGDCWLLAFSAGASATLATFDQALYDYARKSGHASVIPG